VKKKKEGEGTPRRSANVGVGSFRRRGKGKKKEKGLWIRSPRLAPSFSWTLISIAEKKKRYRGGGAPRTSLMWCASASKKKKKKNHIKAGALIPNQEPRGKKRKEKEGFSFHANAGAYGGRNRSTGKGKGGRDSPEPRSLRALKKGEPPPRTGCPSCRLQKEDRGSREIPAARPLLGPSRGKGGKERGNTRARKAGRATSERKEKEEHWDSSKSIVL